MKKKVMLVLVVGFVLAGMGLSAKADYVAGDFGSCILSLTDGANVCDIDVYNTNLGTPVSSQNVGGNYNQPVATFDGGFVARRTDGYLMKYGSNYAYQAAAGLTALYDGTQVTRLSNGNIAVWRQDGFRGIFSGTNLSQIGSYAYSAEGTLSNIKPTVDGGYIGMTNAGTLVKVDASNNLVGSVAWGTSNVTLAALSNGNIAAVRRTDGYYGFLNSSLTGWLAGGFYADVQEMIPTSDGGVIAMRADSYMTKLNASGSQIDARYWTDPDVKFTILSNGDIAIMRNIDGYRGIVDGDNLSNILYGAVDGAAHNLKQMLPTADGGYAAIRVDGLLIKFDSANNVVAGAGSSWTNGEITALIPEPATVALLGLGSIAMIRRRK